MTNVAARLISGSTSLGRTRAIVVAGSFVALISSMPATSLQTLGLFMRPVTSEMGWSRTTFFLGSTIGVLLIAVTAPAIGRVADRIGIRAVLVPGVIGYALSLAAMALVPRSVPLFIALSVAVFLFGQIHTYQLYARAVTAWTDRSRGFMLAVMMTGTAVGNMMMPRVAASLIDNYGWRIAYLGLGAIVLIVATPIALLVVREPTPAERARSHVVPPAELGLTLKEALRERTYWVLIVFSFVSNFAFYGILTNFVPILSESGVGQASAVNALTAVAFSQFFGRLASGWFLDRVGRPRISLAWFMLSTLGIIMVGHSAGQWLTLVAPLLIGIAWGAEAEMNSFFVSRYFGLRAFAQINATVYSSIALAGALAPIASALIFDRTGSYAIALSGASALMIMSCVLLALLGPYRFLPTSPAGRPYLSNGD